MALAAPKRCGDRAEELGREMVALTAHISAAEARFLELLAEFDRDELWACYGCSSAVEWLNWQCGLGAVAGRERLRVARALAKLPKISEAFRRGEVSYSKVREMTRIASAENEAQLLAIARCGTAADVQRLVRKHQRAEQLETAAETAEQYRSRYVRYRYEEDGMLVIEARLPPEIGEVVLKALDAAVEVAYRDGRAEKRSEEAAAETDSTAGGNPVETESNVPAEARQHRTDGDDRTVDVAAEACTESPACRAEQARGNSIIEESEAERSSASLGARRADALVLIGHAFLANGAGSVDTSADRYQVVVHIDQRLLAAGAEARAGADPEVPGGKGGNDERREDDGPNDERPRVRRESLSVRCELESGRALAIETARRLACDCTLVGIVEGEDGEPLNVGRKTRAISPALKRALQARDGGCRFPSCTRTYTQGHHVIHWVNGGETKLRNVVSLCAAHHRLVHEGGFSVKRTSDGKFVCFDPHGRQLPQTGRLDRRTRHVLTDAAARGRVALRELNLELGVDIDETVGVIRNGDGVRRRTTH